MAKNHRLQSRTKQQPQTPALSPPRASTLDAVAASSSNMNQVSAVDGLEEDDICPVCESECTCNRPKTVSHLSHAFTAASLYPTSREGGTSSHNQPSHLPSLKIKLTLPPSLHARSLVSGAGIIKSNNGGSSKKKSKSRAETTFDAANVGGSNVAQSVGSPFSAVGQPLISGSASRNPPTQIQGNALKRKGRPSKNARTTRSAAQHQDLIEDASGEYNDTDEERSNVETARQAARQPAYPKSVSSHARKNKMKAHNGSSGRKYKKAAVIEILEAESLSDIDDTDSAQSIQFPTFISACSSSAATESSASDFDSDNEANKQTIGRREAARLRKDVLGDVDHSPHRKWDSDLGHRNNWEIRPRKKSVGSDAGVEADSDSDSEKTEADEADAEPEAELNAEAEEDEEDMQAPGVRLMRYAGVATGWTDDEESSFDADVFFANLSDSSDDQMAAAAADFDGPTGFEAELDEDEVMEEVFETDILGFDFSLGDSVLNALTLTEVADELERRNKELTSDQDNMNLNNGIIEEPDIMMATSEEEEAVAAIEGPGDNGNSQSTSESDDFLQDEDAEDMFDCSDGGSTTEDEYVDVDGVATPRKFVLLRFPASLGAVDPMRTMSPLTSPVVTRPRALDDIASKGTRSKAPKPADILAGRVKPGESTTGQSNSPALKLPASSPDESRLPLMGSFQRQPTDGVKKVVITGVSGVLPPSPFPAICRLRGRSASSSKCSRSGSEAASVPSRPSSLLSSTRSPYQSMLSGDFSRNAPDSPELPPANPMDLADVLVSSFLDADPAKEQATTSNASGEGEDDSEVDAHRHIQHLQRWDRIPVNTFRRTTTAGAGGTSDLEGKPPMGTWIVPGLRRAPRPADGFSYGSAAGGMLRGSPFSSTTLWEGGGAGVNSVSSSPTSERGRNFGGRKGQTHGNMAVIISPVLLPVRDGDRTPTSKGGSLTASAFIENNHGGGGGGSGGSTMSQHASLARALSIKSRKELRKEKRTRKGTAFTSTSFQKNRHHHFPNLKSRSTSSVQRACLSGSVPPLSI